MPLIKTGVLRNIALLEDIIDGKVRNKKYGLCTNAHLETWSEDHKNMLRRWKYFSGSVTFPVPHKSLLDIEAYNTVNLYDRRTTYGKLRIDLAKHLVKELKLLIGE